MLRRETTLPQEGPPGEYSEVSTNALETAGGGGSSAWLDHALLVQGVIGVVGNAFAITVILSYKKLRQRLNMILIINQSAVDLMASMFNTALYSTILVYQAGLSPYHGTAGSAFCKLWTNAIWSWGFMTSSSWNLVAITLERYLSIAYPIHHKTSVTRTKLYVTAWSIWLLGLCFRGAFAIPSAWYANGHCYIYDRWLADGWQTVFGVTSPIVQFFLPALLMISMYGRMFLVLRRKVRPATTSSQLTVRHNIIPRARKNMLKTLVLVTACFVCLWITNQMYWFLTNTGLHMEMSDDFHFITVFMVYMNCWINPFIYIFKYREFQAAMRSLCGCKLEVDLSSSSHTGN